MSVVDLLAIRLKNKDPHTVLQPLMRHYQRELDRLQGDLMALNDDVATSFRSSKQAPACHAGIDSGLSAIRTKAHEVRKMIFLTQHRLDSLGGSAQTYP
jgi:hypothetical protein